MKLMVRDIQRETARYFDLPVETMWEPRGCGAGTRERSWPRQVAMCLSRRLFMTAQVIEIASRESVDQAWEAFREHAARSIDDRSLILDRGYMETWAKLEAKFKRLSIMPRAY